MTKLENGRLFRDSDAGKDHKTEGCSLLLLGLTRFFWACAYPSSAAAASTLLRVSGLTPGFPFSAMDTAAAEMPSMPARSLAVTSGINVSPYFLLNLFHYTSCLLRSKALNLYNIVKQRQQNIAY
jgi:hypothetical protein